jgi:hypothetical protein
MVIHDDDAIKRNITFTNNIKVKTSIKASDHCCWNCSYSNMTYESLWCDREMGEVDHRDLCTAWENMAPNV